MAYTPHTKEQTDEMLKAIGVSSVDDLFKDIKDIFHPIPQKSLLQNLREVLT